MPESPTEFRAVVDLQRADIEAIGQRVKGLKENTILVADPTIHTERRNEIFANITLAYRHLEDARMRLGKVLQHYEGGPSKYDAPSINHQPSTINPQ